ncbi:MAG: division/cell wall cluster transcriptional repressor MraZ [Alphaproteobacteria bacterium]|nr:division/cell wall cluster transcriptional repressor MraZ [Alphaproteobacteria bacterium]
MPEGLGRQMSYAGTFPIKMDRKGRVSVPAEFREVIKPMAFQGLRATPSLNHAAIDCLDHDTFEKQKQDIERQTPAFSVERETMMAALHADSRRLGFDPEGRILLPDDFIAFAGLGDRVVFIGVGELFQIWEPEAGRAYVADMRRKWQELRARLGARPREGGT